MCLCVCERGFKFSYHARVGFVLNHDRLVVKIPLTSQTFPPSCASFCRAKVKYLRQKSKL